GNARDLGEERGVAGERYPAGPDGGLRMGSRDDRPEVARCCRPDRASGVLDRRPTGHGVDAPRAVRARGKCADVDQVEGSRFRYSVRAVVADGLGATGDPHRPLDHRAVADQDRRGTDPSGGRDRDLRADPVRVTDAEQDARTTHSGTARSVSIRELSQTTTRSRSKARSSSTRYRSM